MNDFVETILLMVINSLEGILQETTTREQFCQNWYEVEVLNKIEIFGLFSTFFVNCLVLLVVKSRIRCQFQLSKNYVFCSLLTPVQYLTHWILLYEGFSI